MVLKACEVKEGRREEGEGVEGMCRCKRTKNKKKEGRVIHS